LFVRKGEASPLNFDPVRPTVYNRSPLATVFAFVHLALATLARTNKMAKMKEGK
jgi:hypothetical protein